MGLLASTFDVIHTYVIHIGKVWYSLGGAHVLWGWREALGWACWRQLSMSNVWYSLGGAHTFWLSMGLEGGLGMGLLASTFDVECVVFPMRGSHFLAFYGAGGRPWDGLVGVNFRCRMCGIPYAGLTLSGFLWGWREA